MSAKRNIYLWYAASLFSAAAFTLPVWVVFNTETLGLTNTQAFILGILVWGTSVLFEIPTGSWSDKYDRRMLYALGTALHIAAIASYLFTSEYLLLAGFQVLGGFGLALTSGGIEALVHDSLSDDPDKHNTYMRIHGRKSAIIFGSRIATVLPGGYLFSISPTLPYVFTAASLGCALVLALFLTETRSAHVHQTSHTQHIAETFRLLLGNRALSVFFGLIVLYCFASEATFAVIQPYLRSIDIKVENFGVFYTVISITSTAGALAIARIVRRLNVFVTLLAMMCAVALALGAFITGNVVLIYLAIIPMGFSFGCAETLHNATTQNSVPSSHQAAAVSIASSVRYAPYAISSIAIGIALDVVTANAVVKALLVASLVGLVPFVIAARRKLVLQSNEKPEFATVTEAANPHQST